MKKLLFIFICCSAFSLMASERLRRRRVYASPLARKAILMRAITASRNTATASQPARAEAANIEYRESVTEDCQDLFFAPFLCCVLGWAVGQHRSMF